MLRFEDIIELSKSIIVKSKEMEKKLGIIIQARAGSTRLPNKMLKPFYKNKTILDILLQRIVKNVNPMPIVVATSKEKKDDGIYDIPVRNGVSCFRGNELDVLNRFIGAAKTNNLTSCIRICADNPFLSMEKLIQLINYVQTSSADYVSFKMDDGTPSIKTHYGFWAEYITLSALEKINNLTDEKLFHEHVTNYAYSNPKKFNVDFLPIDDFIQKSTIRLTVDTAQDFETAKYIYSELMSKNLEIEPVNIIPLITEEIRNRMQFQMQQNSK